ncbi:hypothetical protein ACIF9R_00975 [Streptomyces sp. NPDC086080]|uniref:hypothetical protein n=1 Tax=Streptomyces sp. NPDC086080 TaxID=3365748 RepID=UPI0037D49A1C
MRVMVRHGEAVSRRISRPVKSRVMPHGADTAPQEAPRCAWWNEKEPIAVTLRSPHWTYSECEWIKFEDSQRGRRSRGSRWAAA